ncbi:mechanosensitive ion channel family protein [Novosphingobium sp. KA1]|uniref:mechanosensitive ion channel family protein n=1 Tax=Novosphingobium sp. (strain KA1) TaxID=164608 RepID=UPI001A8D5D71|nr:mechanosensitive ion channel family protein [Novosphingobium sp. KA1]QSR18982.1 hypothetical protein CA833_17600 [Novosphingobium sp. KA1]
MGFGTDNRKTTWGKSIRLALAAGLLGLSGAQALAEDKPKDEPTEAASPPSDPLERENPRNMQIGMMAAIGAQDDALLARYIETGIETGKASPEQAAEQARQFRLLLDKAGSIAQRLALPLAAEGALDDGLPPDEEKIGNLTAGGEEIPIIARRTEDDEGRKIWRVSAQTLAQALAAEPPPPAAEESPVDESQRKLVVLGAPLSSWVLLLGVGLTIFAAVVLLFRILYHRLAQQSEDGKPHPVAAIIYAMVPPATLMAIYQTISTNAEPLGMGLAERAAIARLSGIVVWAGATWLAWRLVAVAGDFISDRFRATGHAQRIGMTGFIIRSIRLLILAIAIAAFLATFGIDVTAGLAALGIGGLAFALGARQAVEDLIGGIALLLDRPVQVGDLCRIDGEVGRVDEIGLRSTRIRTRDRTILTIPNSQLSDSKIENLEKRDRFFVSQKVGVSYSAGAEGLARALEVLRSTLTEDPHYIPSICPIRLLGFTDGCFEIEIHAHLRCPSHSEGFLRQEALMLAVLRAFEREGLEIAVPGRRLTMEPDSARAASGFPGFPPTPNPGKP